MQQKIKVTSTRKKNHNFGLDMALLGKADWLLRSVTAWPATYFAFLFSFITHAIASIIKAAFFFYPPSISPQKAHDAEKEMREWRGGGGG